VDPIALRPRDSSLICPPCRDTIGAGAKIACPECGAVYHEECGLTFGRCVNLACAGRLATERRVQALHRIGAIARRLQAWRLEGLVRQIGAQGPWVVFFLPASQEVRGSDDAARVVGEVLDQSTYDGRFRLQASHPELLVRVEARDEVARIVRELRAVGVDAYSVPLVDLVQPLESFRAAAFFNDDPLVCADGSGLCRAYQLPCERLVVPTHYVDTTERTTLAPFSTMAGRWSIRRRTTTHKQRKVERAFFVFRPEEPAPLEVCESALEHLVGVSARPSSRQNLFRVREAFASGPRAMSRSLREVEVPRLMTPTLVEGDLNQRSNRTTVRLMARLIYRAWLEARRKRPAKPVAVCV
jgi:hypothetical protein